MEFQTVYGQNTSRYLTPTKELTRIPDFIAYNAHQNEF
jgi:hypothetical protein